MMKIKNNILSLYRKIIIMFKKGEKIVCINNT
jgi:hypothetical protein